MNNDDKCDKKRAIQRFSYYEMTPEEFKKWMDKEFFVGFREVAPEWDFYIDAVTGALKRKPRDSS